MIAGHDKIFNFQDRRQQFAWLAIILAAAFALRLYIALRFPNIHHADEIFQYLEQAHRLVFKYGVAPWEYREGTRSWLVPGFLAGILKLSEVLGLSFPAFYLFLVASALTALSLSVVVVGFLWASRTQGTFAGVITAALCAVWFELVYFAPKTLTEPIAAHILVIAIYLAYPSQPTANKRRLFAAGLLFGLVVAIRVHLAPALIVAAIYICGREVRNKWLPMVLGGLTTLVMAGMLDALTWQYPFQSFIANIWVNIVQQKSNQFGVSPWYYFAGKWVLIWGLAVVPIALLSIVAVRKNILLGLIAATIVATHMLVGHKEYRFVFPAVPFIIILVGLGTAEIYGYFERKLKSRNLVLAGRIGVILVWASISGAVALGNQFRPFLYKGAEEIRAFDFLRERPDMCGVGLVGIEWWETAGYVHLHRDVPIIIPSKDIEPSYPAYNYALVRSQEPAKSWPYSKIMCWGEEKICVYRRDGKCDRLPDIEINAVLRRRGE